MQHLENDMDDLFKRAAENYPLQNGKGDWESIEKRIGDEANLREIVKPRKNRTNEKIIALCLIFFILSVSWLMFQNSNTKIHPGAKVREMKKEMEISTNKPLNEISTANFQGVEEAFNIHVPQNKKDPYKKRVIKSSGNTKGKLITGITIASSYLENDTKTSNEKNSKDDPEMQEFDNSNTDFSKGHRSKEKQVKGLTKNWIKINEEISEQDKAGNIELKNQPKKDGNSVTGKREKKDPTGVLQKKKGVYIGLVAGPDYSKVKSRPFNKSGLGAGLLLGYSVNSKLSFETGVIWNKKNYSSEGRNFIMDKVRSTMAPDMIINSLISQSSLIELPVKVNYRFINIRNSILFVAGGISSYIMTKEKNLYNTTLNGNKELITGIYEKNNFRLPAVFNFSIGYEHSLYKYLGIRIEPYLKVPLKGIGVGSLPVTSAGLQIGIISRLD